MATNLKQGGASALPKPLTAEWLAEVQDRAPKIVAEYERQIGEGSTRLVEPACQRGCPACFRECAVRGIIARWWSEELAKAEAQLGRVLSHDGVIYAEPMGRA